MKILSFTTLYICLFLLTLPLSSIAMKRTNNTITSNLNNFPETDENFRNLAQAAHTHVKNIVDAIDENINTCHYALQLSPNIHILTSNDKNDRVSYFIINDNFSDNNTQHEEIISALCKKNAYARTAFEYFTRQIKNNIRSVTAKNLKDIENYNSTIRNTRFNLLPLFIRQIIHTQAFENIDCQTRFEHKDNDGILCTALSFKKPIVAISSKNGGLIIFNTQTEKRVATHEQEIPSLLCFNPSGLCVATMTYSSDNNQSTIKQYNTTTGNIQHSIALNGYCHHISYRTKTNKRIISAITGTNELVLPHRKTTIEFSKNRKHIIEVQTLLKLEEQAYYDRPCDHYERYCKYKKSEHCTIFHQTNNSKIVTQATVSTKTPLNFYLCHKAIQNTYNREHLQKIKNSQSYISLNQHQRDRIDHTFNNQNKSLYLIHLNRMNQSLQHIKY